MKIVLIGPTYPYKGGISHYNTILCNKLSERSYDVVLFSYKRQYPSFLYPGKKQLDKKSNIRTNSDVKVKYIIDTINPFTWIKVYLKIKKENPDLVIFQWVHPYFSFIFFTITYLIKKTTKAKILFICHNVLPHERILLDKILIKMVFKNVDCFIVHSKEDYSNLKKIIPNAKAKQSIHPKYDIFKINRISQEDAKKLLNINSNTILFFGIVREYKGLIYLIKAIPKILNEIDVNLLIVGEFWDDKNKYIDEIKKLGIENHVKIIDKYIPDDEVGFYFSASDVVVLPYISATQSGVIQTAYAFEKPIITTNVGGLPEVIDNGKTGIIIKPKDSKELANAIINYFKNNRKEEFINNIKNKNKEFSWERLIRDIENLVQKTIENNKINRQKTK